MDASVGQTNAPPSAGDRHASSEGGASFVLTVTHSFGSLVTKAKAGMAKASESLSVCTDAGLTSMPNIYIGRWVRNGTEEVPFWEPPGGIDYVIGLVDLRSLSQMGRSGGAAQVG